VVGACAPISFTGIADPRLSFCTKGDVNTNKLGVDGGKGFSVFCKQFSFYGKGCSAGFTPMPPRCKGDVIKKALSITVRNTEI